MEEKDFLTEPELELELPDDKLPIFLVEELSFPPNGDDATPLVSDLCKVVNFPLNVDEDVPGKKMDSLSTLARFSSGPEVGTRRRSDAIRTSSSDSGRSFISKRATQRCSDKMGRSGDNT